MYTGRGYAVSYAAGDDGDGGGCGVAADAHKCPYAAHEARRIVGFEHCSDGGGDKKDG